MPSAPFSNGVHWREVEGAGGSGARCPNDACRASQRLSRWLERSRSWRQSIKRQRSLCGRFGAVPFDRTKEVVDPALRVVPLRRGSLEGAIVPFLLRFAQKFRCPSDSCEVLLAAVPVCTWSTSTEQPSSHSTKSTQEELIHRNQHAIK